MINQTSIITSWTFILIHHNKSNIHHDKSDIHHKKLDIHLYQLDIHHNKSDIHHNKSDIHHNKSDIHHGKLDIPLYMLEIHHKKCTNIIKSVPNIFNIISSLKLLTRRFSEIMLKFAFWTEQIFALVWKEAWKQILIKERINSLWKIELLYWFFDQNCQRIFAMIHIIVQKIDSS